MTRSADMDFVFYEPVEISSILSVLSESGVRFHDKEKLSYVLDEDGMFDWVQVENAELDRVVRAADGVDPESSVFVITMFFAEGEEGGELLFHKGRKEVSFMATVNRKFLPGSSEFCNFGWYLERLIPVFEPIGLAEFTAHDYK